MSIEEKIKQFIIKNLYFVEDHVLADDASFLNEGIIDSMGSMELVAFVESEFGIKVEMSEVVVKNFDSVRQLADFVRRKLGAREEAGGKALERPRHDGAPAPPLLTQTESVAAQGNQPPIPSSLSE